MATTLLAGAVMGLMVVVAATAAKGDLNITRADIDQKQAYEAARAGLADYAYHLNQDTNYWTKCTNVPNPSAVNQKGSTAKRRPVPGTTGSRYAIELIPATGYSSCNTSNPTQTMLEGGTNAGTFRIRSTGYSGNSEQSIVATFKRASFLDYLYFTQLETSDPVTYNNQQTINGAYTQCTKTIQGGRYSQNIPGSSPQQICSLIYFVGGETINGPLHTNDSFLVCNGSPTFGRTALDQISTSSASPGWYTTCNGSTPTFVGTFVLNAPVLTPPPTNGALKTIAASAYRFTGQTTITLNPTTMTIQSGGTTQTKAYPANGVVYVSNGTCSAAYSPFTAPNKPAAPGSSCGNVYVKGTYKEKLTIAAENDIIIEDDLIRTDDGLLGLVANNFVRVYHPFAAQTDFQTCNYPRDSQNNPITTNPTGAQPNLRVDAAILAIQHSFIVDHYNCGNTLNNLTVNGAIAQKFRGAVGTFNGGTPPSTGYVKQYTYDDRLKYISPPHFLDPVESAWSVQRETLD